MEFMHLTNAVKKSTLQSNISHRDSEHEASRQPLADNWKPVQHFEVISNTSGNTDLPDTNKSGYYLYLFFKEKVYVFQILSEMQLSSNSHII